MNLLELLKTNKGTVSSALGKELAQNVLDGNLALLKEAVEYVCYELDEQKSKSVRAGAAKILEKVAEKKPELVAPYLSDLKPALNVQEPQTRWMLMQVFGYCAQIQPEISSSVLNYATKFLHEGAGICLTGSVHLYLGRVGATSKEMAHKVLPMLDDAYQAATENEVDWILEAFLNIVDLLDANSVELIEKNTKLQLEAKKKSTQNRAKKILKKINSLKIHK
jgi:hypothetical protein